MKDVLITDAVSKHARITSPNIIFSNINYKNSGEARIIFNSNCIFFSLKGNGIFPVVEKSFLYQGINCVLKEEDSPSLSASPGTHESSHLAILFPGYLVTDFLFRKHVCLESACLSVQKQFPLYQHPLLKEYIHQLSTWVKKEVPVSENMAEHKFEELLIILWERFSVSFFIPFLKQFQSSGLQVKQIVEDKLLDNLSLEELASRSHKSLSSFKREFEKLYGVPPGKYIREKKLEVAAQAIIRGKKTSEIYMDFGYETTSNFIYAFKRKFLCTPKEYKKRHAYS